MDYSAQYLVVPTIPDKLELKVACGTNHPSPVTDKP
jgi:hypothetical protein